MDRAREMEVFVAVAMAGGFAKAARQLGLSPPAVTRLVAGLEARIGTRLLNRTTRKISLTDSGRRYLANARRLLADIDDAERDAAGDQHDPHGHVTITAPATFGRAVLTPVLLEFLATASRVTASALLLDRVTDLVGEGIDVAVRVGDLPESSLVARRVGAVRRLLVASPDYLARLGAPDTPDALQHHTIIAMTGLMPDQTWRFEENGRRRAVGLSPRLELNDAAAALASARAGHGITVALSYMVADDIRAGHLAPVLDRYAPAEVPVHLVHASGRIVGPAVRAFLDFAAPRLRSELDRIALSPPIAPPGAL
jgi:DNA-binding transcriptional LysR family regulator